MRPFSFVGALLLCGAGSASAAVDIENWPTKVTFADGTQAALTGNVNYDVNDFSDDAVLEDEDGVRRKEFGFTLKKKGTYDAMVYFDFQAHAWLDVFFRFETKALFGTDAGRVRLGYVKVPVGFEGVTSARADSFLETSLPIQAIYQARRTGAEWTFERAAYLLQAGAYGGKDLQGDNPGTTQAVRGVWTPAKAEGNVVHLGLALSRENPRSRNDGRGVNVAPSARLRARPEAGLTDTRLVDTGALAGADHIDRAGLEGLWINGPFSLQGEALRAKVSRDGFRDFSANGQYVFASWVLTGESRPYTAGNVGNIKPKHGYGAIELLARYSRLDLDDNGVLGGREHDWTLGANWYLTTHFKFQANYVHTNAERRDVRRDPDIVELRAQVYF